MHKIIEIKAKCSTADHIRSFLITHNADFKGTDHQIDTYFKVQEGRLKHRRGNIENSLIFYNRPNQSGPKKSEVTFEKLTTNNQLDQVLAASNGILIQVDKLREIYFIDNVKFHIDTVKNLGNFVEIEAIDTNGDLPEETLLLQCQHYLKSFNIDASDLITNSYSDLLMKND